MSVKLRCTAIRRPIVDLSPIGQEKTLRFLRALMADRAATTAVEYALLGALISVVAISAINNVGNSLSNLFVAVATDMSNSGNGSL